MALANTPQRGEHGFSLIESLIAIAILGIIVSAMVGGMATSITMSGLHRQEASANAVMVSAAEVVKHAPYAPCNVPSYSELWSQSGPSASAVLPTGWEASAVAVFVQYWNQSLNTFDSICRDNGGSDPFPMQLVTIRVTAPGNNASTSVGVVKRGP